MYAWFLIFALFVVLDDAEQIKSWWIWGYWSSALMYAQNAIIVNEFTGNNWKRVCIYVLLVNSFISNLTSVRKNLEFRLTNWQIHFFVTAFAKFK